jgi:2-polyprenyl-3-methyl-5-hydroxy-6-metoxy-1,4-benzoquinol methylase
MSLRAQSRYQMPDCPNCKVKCSKFLSTRDYNRHVSGEKFDYFRCPRCHFLFLNPIPMNLTKYYPDDYYGPVPQSAEAILSAARIIEGYKLELIQKYCPKAKSILEVGPSMGGFAFLCKESGYSIHTIEMSEICARFLSEVGQIPTIHTSDELSALDDAPDVDVIALWHVIEHLRNPFEFLKKAIQKTQKGGYLVIAAPNPESIQFAVLKKRWAHLDAPRHVSLMPIKLLKKILEINSFETSLQTTLDTGGLMWNEFGWKHSHTKLSASRFAKAYEVIIDKFLAPLERQLDKGSCYTLIVQKK